MTKSEKLFSDVSPEAYERDWSPAHDRVFSGRHLMEGAFRDLSWEVIILPYAPIDHVREFDALARAARNAGDDVLVIADAMGLSLPEPARLIARSFTAISAVWTQTDLWASETHLFGVSASWGVVCTLSDFTLVGGRPEFMDLFTERLGGREVMKQHFLEFSAGLFPEEDRRRVLALAGWTPESPPSGHGSGQCM